MTITTLPPAPSRQSPTTFSDDADAFLSALPTFGDEANATAADINQALEDAETALSVADWAELYLGYKVDDPVLDNQGNALLTGALYFNSSNDIMRVYNGASWQDASSSVNGTANRYSYIATEGQTTFAATYDIGYIDVYVNGIRLTNADFVATNNTSIVLNVAAPAGTSIEIIGYGNFMFDMQVPSLATNKFLTNNGSDLTWGNPLPCAQIADASLASGTYSFDYSNGDMQQLTAAGDITIDFINFPVGKVTTFIIDALNWGSYAITLPAGMLFSSGTRPHFSVLGTDRLVIIKDKDEVFSLFVVGTEIAVVA